MREVEVGRGGDVVEEEKRDGGGGWERRRGEGNEDESTRHRLSRHRTLSVSIFCLLYYYFSRYSFCKERRTLLSFTQSERITI